MTGDLPTIAASKYQSMPVNFMGAALHVGKQHQGSLGNVLDSVLKDVQPEVPMPNRRLVQVFIADPNENVPLEDSLLYSGEQKLTDATDQELFFEIDIKGILEKHNEKRVKMIDKTVKERSQYLEPAKIRELKMVVVQVAGF